VWLGSGFIPTVATTHRWASKAQTTQDARQLSQTLDMDTSTESYLSRNCVQPDEEMLLRTFANAVQYMQQSKGISMKQLTED